MLFEVEHLESPELLARLRELTRMDNQSTARLVAHLSEFDARELYVAEGFSSCFKYCVQVLHYSEATAYRRIEAGRTARRFPVILERIADGSLHLTAVTLLAPHLTAENHRALLESARHRTRRQIESLLAAMHPERSVAPRSSIVPLPRRHFGRFGSGAGDTGLGGAAGSGSASGGASALASLDMFEPAPAPSGTRSALAGSHSAAPQSVGTRTATAGDPANVAPQTLGLVGGSALPSAAAGPPPTGPEIPGVPPTLSRGAGTDDEPGRYRLHVTISEGTRAKLEQAQRLMSHINPSGDLAPILDRALAALIVALEKRKFGRLVRDPGVEGSTGEPRKRERTHVAAGQEPPVVATENRHTGPARQRQLTITPRKRTRYISPSVRRAVWHRDEGRCTFVSTTGHPCKETERLEFHHILPWSHGGGATSANLTLRCRTHNAYEAETTLGRPAPRTRTRTGESSGHPGDQHPGLPTAGSRKPGSLRQRQTRRRRRDSANAEDTPGSPTKK